MYLLVGFLRLLLFNIFVSELFLVILSVILDKMLLVILCFIFLGMLFDFFFGDGVCFECEVGFVWDGV